MCLAQPPMTAATLSVSNLRYEITEAFAVKEVYVLKVPNLSDLTPERNRMSPTLIKKVRTFSEHSREASVVVRAPHRSAQLRSQPPPPPNTHATPNLPPHTYLSHTATTITHNTAPMTCVSAPPPFHVDLFHGFGYPFIRGCAVYCPQ